MGVLVGVLVGAAGGWLLELASRRGWAAGSFRPVAVLGLAILAYAGALQAAGNGFIAAFVGGLAFGSMVRDEHAGNLELVTDAGELLSVVVWFLFGALLLHALEHADWRAVVYAVLSLTVVRMLPVALALLGSHLDRATVGVMGWFGPRGLASIVFALLAFDSLDPGDGQTVLATIAVVVLLSVVAHGASASPLARWYARRVAGIQPDRPEHAETPALRTRPFTRPRGSRAER